MEVYRKQLDLHRRPVLEEFMPLKNTGENSCEVNDLASEKTSWMMSAQLWGGATKTTAEIDSKKLPPGGGVRGLSDLALAPTERQEEKTGKVKVSVDHRKARRCWTPDLHRRFVNALHALGGSQGKSERVLPLTPLSR